MSSQNTMSRHGGAAIADHHDGSLGSQQNPGPVMVCSPVFNHFSPSLPRPDNYAIGLHDSGQMGQMPGHPYGQAFGSYGPQAVFAFPNHQQSQSFQPSPAAHGFHHVGHVGGRQGVDPTYSGWMGQMPGYQYGQAFGSNGPRFAFPNHQHGNHSDLNPGLTAGHGAFHGAFQHTRLALQNINRRVQRTGTTSFLAKYLQATQIFAVEELLALGRAKLRPSAIKDLKVLLTTDPMSCAVSSSSVQETLVQGYTRNVVHGPEIKIKRFKLRFWKHTHTCQCNAAEDMDLDAEPTGVDLGDDVAAEETAAAKAPAAEAAGEADGAAAAEVAAAGNESAATGAAEVAGETCGAAAAEGSAAGNE